MRMINPMFARPAARVLGYVFAVLSVVAGLVLIADALSRVTDRNQLSIVEGQATSVDRVIRTRARIRPYDKHQQIDSYDIRIVVKQGSRQETLLVPENRLQPHDVSGLRGTQVKALIGSTAEVWELTAPARNYFTYEDTRETQIAGKRLAAVFGPLLLFAGALGLWFLSRTSRGLTPNTH